MIHDRHMRDAKILWNYMVLDEPECSADILLVLGSVDEGVAEHAARLTRHYDYGHVIFSGGIAHSDDMLRTTWQETEAEHFSKVFIEAGGLSENILLETRAENTGQNATYSYELVVSENIPIPRTMQIVTKPYMIRRSRATFEKQWSDHRTSFFVVASTLSFDEYLATVGDFVFVVSAMVGDFQRIIEYPRLGFQTVQDIPKGVVEAWQKLVADGYTKRLM